MIHNTPYPSFPGTSPRYSLRSDTSGSEYLIRSTNLPSQNSFTMMGWFKQRADASYPIYLNHQSTTNGRYILFLGDGDASHFETYNLDNTHSGENINAPLVLQTWFHLAMTAHGDVLLGYVNGVLNSTSTVGGAGAFPAANIRFCGTADGAGANANFAALKVFNRALTAREIAREMTQYVPLIGPELGLNSWVPAAGPTLEMAAKDFGPYKRHFTAVGTMVLEAGPPIPWIKPRPFSWWVDAPSAGGSQQIAMPLGAAAVAGGAGGLHIRASNQIVITPV